MRHAILSHPFECNRDMVLLRVAVVGKMIDSFAHDGCIPEEDEDGLDESVDEFNARFDALPSEYSAETVGSLKCRFC